MVSAISRILHFGVLALLWLVLPAQFASGELHSVYARQVDDLKMQPCSIDLISAVNQEGIRKLTPVISRYYEDPYSLPIFLTDIAEMMLQKHIPVSERSQYAFRLLGAPAGGIGPPLAGTGNKIKPCISATELKGTMDHLISSHVILEDLTENSSWQNLGFNDQNLIIYLINVIHEANLLFMEYEMTVMKSQEDGYTISKDVRRILLEPIQNREMRDFSSIDFYEDADLRKLSFASRVLMEHIGMAMSMIHDCDQADQKINFQCNTKYGRIGYFGSADNTIDGTFALIIDLGGDDIYNGNIACTQPGISSVGIHIDLDGNDTYGSDKRSSVCRAELGAAILIDLGGNDSYEVSGPGLANTCFGCSYLFDRAGDDIYSAKGNYSIASAIAGVAILDDRGGNDIYHSGSYSQGYAGPAGCGILLDFQGNDIYGSYEDEKISFVQGSSKGRWAEATDGHSLAGGCGFLIDGAGNDVYSAYSFAQGAAYYFGAGFLSDLSGDDSYDAISHSQAYGVHFSLACMAESMGSDRYNLQADTTRITQIMASGRDHSAGILVELEGDDTYCFGNRSLGISDMEGIGVFLDFEGEDSFKHFTNSVYGNNGSCGKIFKAEGMMKRFHIAPINTKPAAIFYDH